MSTQPLPSLAISYFQSATPTQYTVAAAQPLPALSLSYWAYSAPAQDYVAVEEPAPSLSLSLWSSVTGSAWSPPDPEPGTVRLLMFTLFSLKMQVARGWFSLVNGEWVEEGEAPPPALHRFADGRDDLGLYAVGGGVLAAGGADAMLYVLGGSWFAWRAPRDAVAFVEPEEWGVCILVDAEGRIVREVLPGSVTSVSAGYTVACTSPFRIKYTLIQ